MAADTCYSWLLDFLRNWHPAGEQGWAGQDKSYIPAFNRKCTVRSTHLVCSPSGGVTMSTVVWNSECNKLLEIWKFLYLSRHVSSFCVEWHLHCVTVFELVLAYLFMSYNMNIPQGKESVFTMTDNTIYSKLFQCMTNHTLRCQ